MWWLAGFLFYINTTARKNLQEGRLDVRIYNYATHVMRVVHHPYTSLRAVVPAGARSLDIRKGSIVDLGKPKFRVTSDDQLVEAPKVR